GASISGPPPNTPMPHGPTEFAGSVAVAIGLYTNTVNSYIDSGATVDAGGSLSVTTEALNDWQLPYLVNLYQSATAQPTYKTGDPGAKAQQVNYGDIVEVDDQWDGALVSLLDKVTRLGHWYQYVGPGSLTLDLTKEDYTDTT